jgi:hypothetical protein
MTDIAISSPMEQWATVTETSLTMHAGTPMNAWEEIGRSLGSISRSSKWLLADWLVQGEALYGEHYAQGMDATGLSYQTLMNLATVGRRVAPEVRRGDLSHAHHAEVTKFETADEQSHWLEVAAAEKLTVKALRERIRGPKAEPAGPVAKIAALIERWWDETAGTADGYSALLAGTDADRRPLFLELAERIAKA